MRLNQFESEENRDRREMPWRKHAPPVNKPVNANNPNNSGPIDTDRWNKNAAQYPKKSVEEEVDGIPEVGDVIRTKKMQMEGKVESLGKNRAGYDEVFFRIEDGRLMKTPLKNVTVVEKLADCDLVMEVTEDRIDEISTEVLAKYKTAAAADARSADKKGDIARGNKRFSGIVKATNKQFDNDAKRATVNVKEEPDVGKEWASDTELDQYIPDKLAQEWRELVGYNEDGMAHPLWLNMAGHGEPDSNDVGDRGMMVNVANKWASMKKIPIQFFDVRDIDDELEWLVTIGVKEGSMGGINRSAPAQDVSYEKVLDEVKAMWEESQLNELSVKTLKAYKDAAGSPEVMRHAPLRKIVKHTQGAQVANQKIRTKTGDRSNDQDGRGSNE